MNKLWCGCARRHHGTLKTNPFYPPTKYIYIKSTTVYVPSSDIYKEYHSVCPLVGIGTPPTPLPQASEPSPSGPKGGGVHTRLRLRAWGSPNSNDWRKSLALCYSVLSAHPLSLFPPPPYTQNIGDVNSKIGVETIGQENGHRIPRFVVGGRGWVDQEREGAGCRFPEICLRILSHNYM
jgi:hypothetical protein